MKEWVTVCYEVHYNDRRMLKVLITLRYNSVMLLASVESLYM